MKNMRTYKSIFLVLTCMIIPQNLRAVCFQNEALGLCNEASKKGEQILIPKTEIFATIGESCAKNLVREKQVLPKNTRLFFLERTLMKRSISDALKVYAAPAGSSEVRIFEGCQIFPVFQDQYKHNLAASGSIIITLKGDDTPSTLEELRLPYPIQHQRLSKMSRGVRIHILDIDGDLLGHVANLQKTLPEAGIELGIVSEYLLRLELK